MKKKLVKTISISLAALLAIAGISYSALSGNEKVASADTSKDAKTIQNTIESNVKFNEVGEDKEETVYVLTDANGNVNKTIVSDWLKNKDGSDKLEDKSDLKDIENVKSDADYITEEDGAITWNANGEDIYYQGTTDKQLPVDVKVTYLLDGKEMSPSEIAGKSGKVTIKFEYTNNQKKEITVNGKKTEMYVPFTMISGMILDGNKFRNVEVNSGKVISDGNRLVVVGLGFPGMNSNLALSDITSDGKTEFPETVEVTADVEDFSLALTLTMGSADLISAVDVDSVTAVDDLKDVVKKLVESTDALQTGSAKLNEGLKTLKNSFGTYSTGIKTYVNTVNSNIGLLNEKVPSFVDGTKQISDGVGQIVGAMEGDNGAVSGANQLAQGSAELSNGLNDLANSVGTVGSTDNNTVTGAVNNIATGSSTLFSYVDKMLAGFDDQNGSYGLTNGSKAVSDGSKAVSDGVNALVSQLNKMIQTINTSISDNEKSIAQLNAVIRGGKNPQTGADLTAQEIAVYNAQIQQLTGANTALKTMLQNMNPETMNQQLTTLSQGAKSVADGASGVLNGVATLQNGLKEFKTQGNTLVQGTAQLNSSMSQLVAGIGKLQAGSVQVKDGSAALASGVNQLYGAVKNQLQPGVSTLYDGANLLSTSVNQLYEGTKPTAKDVNTLLSGTDQLASGIGELQTGAETLSSGMKQFNDEAISKVSDFVNGDLTTITERIKATVNLAKDYNIYSDALEGKSTSVKFVYETDGINVE
ncbi:MAG: hypothetical protein SOV90_10670 [Lachnospiraceae bacterium]|nr:hypothetical protein [Lachnospiraceae bacterium]